MSWLSQGTGQCASCAETLLAMAMKTPAARAWLESWEIRFRGLMTVAGMRGDAAEDQGVPVLPFREGRHPRTVQES